MEGDDLLKKIIKLSFIILILFVFQFYGVQAQTREIINLEPSISSEEYNDGINEEIFNGDIKPSSRILEVPIIFQRPELPTGCEITAITMMLNYHGCNVNKVQLAHEMPYHPSNPDLGYVGNPFSKSGWTIYPSPLCGLVKKYAGNAVNLTGTSIEVIENHIAENKPVVAWVNMHGFTVHAIVITGYDVNNFYCNDPWTGDKGRGIDKNKFFNIWNLQNKRALSY